MLEITPENFSTEIENEKLLVVAMFSASWCPPCKVLKPIMEKYAEEVKDTMKVVYVNVEDNEALAKKYNIISVPTLIVFKNGFMHARTLGSMSLVEVRKFCGSVA